VSIGEQTLLVTRPTRLIALRWYVLAVVFLGLAGVFFFRVIQAFYPSFPSPNVGSWSLGTIAGGAFVFFAFVSLLVAEVFRKSTKYIITDNKIIREDGILSKNSEMIPYTQLERVDVRQSFGDRILRIGTIVVDTGDDTLNIDKVRNPRKIQDLLSSRLGRKAWAGQPPPQNK
jgi:uncharacterized membrane protein YdbT with pleckstrin-like domain